MIGLKRKTGHFRMLILSALLMLGGMSSGQQLWSLEDCINYAIDNNIDIKKQILMVRGGEADYLESKLNLLPDLNAGGNNIYNWGQTIDKYTNTFATQQVRSNNFYLSSNLMLFQGLQKINTMKQNQLDLTASQLDLDVMMDNISLAVAGFYLDILFNEELNAVANEQLAVTTQQVERMKKLVDAGSRARGDLLNLEAQLATEELQVVETENAIRISYLNLMQLIDHPVSEDFKVGVPELRPIEAPSAPVSPDGIFDVALGIRPEIKSAEIRFQSARKGVAIARGYQSPVISMNGQWATGYSGAAQEGLNPTLDTVPIGFTGVSYEPVYGIYESYQSYQTTAWDDQMNNNQNKTLGFNFQLPIFNGWQVRTAINKAKYAQENAELNLQQEKLDLRKKIQQAYIDAVSALKNFNSANKKVEAQQEAFKYASQKMDVGMMNAVDYNKTKKDLTQAESELLQAKYRYIYTTTILNFYMGKPLSFE